MTKIKNIKLAYVEWLDSLQYKTVWWGVEDLFDDTKKPTSSFRTIGYLVNENKQEYIFASSIHDDVDGGIKAFGHIFVIPKGCVTKIKFIKI